LSQLNTHRRSRFRVTGNSKWCHHRWLSSTLRSRRRIFIEENSLGGSRSPGVL